MIHDLPCLRLLSAAHGLCRTSSLQRGSLKPHSLLRVLLQACCKHSCRPPPFSPFISPGFMPLTWKVRIESRSSVRVLMKIWFPCVK